MSSMMQSAKLATPKLINRKFIAVCAVLFLGACSSEPEPAPPLAVQTPPPPVAEPTRAAPVSQVVPGSIADFEQNVGDRVFFEYDSSTLNQTDRDTLGRQAAWLSQFPNIVLTIEGHCDERGTREYNLALGARRAAAVREHLISLGVSAARIETISYGSERPVCAESVESCWQLNRRGVSTIRGGAAS